MKRTHEAPQNALADIALLLLIFFLITTQFPKEEGIKTNLPPLSLQPISQEYDEIEIWLNAQDQVMVNGKSVEISHLSNQVYHRLNSTHTNTRISTQAHGHAHNQTFIGTNCTLAGSHLSA